MLLLLLAACGVTTRPTCIDTRTELADDEVTDLGFSPAELLAAVAGARSEEARWSHGERTTVTVDVARGEGPAVFVQSESGTIERPNGQLFGRETLLVAVRCEDYVEVPTSLAIDTDDGLMALASGEAVTSASDLVRVDVRLDLDADAMEGVAEATRGEADAGYAKALWIDGEMVSGRVGWSAETEDGGWAENVLVWGD